MYTNQSADLEGSRPPDLRCCHAPGAATEENCAYLRALARLRAHIEQAERAHRAGQADRRLIGELWLLHAEVSTALDACPNTVSAPIPLRRRPVS
ncbi:MAG TPA: hypothetical protein VFY89_00860 [Ktedonobacterales bacterium]